MPCIVYCIFCRGSKREFSEMDFGSFPDNFSPDFTDDFFSQEEDYDENSKKRIKRGGKKTKKRKTKKRKTKRRKIKNKNKK